MSSPTDRERVDALLALLDLRDRFAASPGDYVTAFDPGGDRYEQRCADLASRALGLPAAPAKYRKPIFTDR